MDQRNFVTFKVFSNVIVWQDSVHITATYNYTISTFLYHMSSIACFS